METSTSPPTLPPEIISIIVRKGEESLKTMRLVSRSWNSSVLSHLNDRRYKPVLERVYIRSTTDPDYDDIDEDEEEEDVNDDPTCREIRMWALVPENCAAARIGLGDWLTDYNQFPGAIEVTCSPQKMKIVKKTTDVEACISTLLGGCLIGAASQCLLPTRYSSLFGFALLALLPTLCLYRSYFEEPTEEITSMDTPNVRFARFFPMFSRVDSVVINGSPCWSDYNGVLDTMGDMHVKRFEMRTAFGEKEKERILELVRKHRIRHVSIVTYSITAKHYNHFVRELVRLGATLDIYGRERTVKIFRRSREFWEKKAEELKGEGISMKIEHVLDTHLDVQLQYVKTHFCVRLSEEGNTEGDSIVEQRGYRSKSTW